MGRTPLQILAALFFTGLFAACKKKDCGCIPTPVPLDAQKVFIVCEGSYGNGNSALNLYIPGKDEVYEDMYKAMNNGNTIGDVLQSMIRIDDRYFLCVNNSDKVIALNKDLSVYAFMNVAKPRYITAVSGTKAYISAMYSNRVFVFDPAAISIQDTIELPAKNTEGITLMNDKAYICPWDTATNKVYVINTVTNELTDSIAVAGRAPSEALVDKDGKLWVLSGNVVKGKSAYWTKIDPSTKQILASYAFPANADPVRPVMNNSKDTIYFLEVNYTLTAEYNGVFRMSIYDPTLPATPFIPAFEGQYFWALGISPFSGDIYVGDPRGFTQKSSVLIYNAAGELKKQFSAGVGVGHFYFTY